MKLRHKELDQIFSTILQTWHDLEIRFSGETCLIPSKNFKNFYFTYKLIL